MSLLSFDAEILRLITQHLNLLDFSNLYISVCTNEKYTYDVIDKSLVRLCDVQRLNVILFLKEHKFTVSQGLELCISEDNKSMYLQLMSEVWQLKSTSKILFEVARYCGSTYLCVVPNGWIESGFSTYVQYLRDVNTLLLESDVKCSKPLGQVETYSFRVKRKYFDQWPLVYLNTLKYSWEDKYRGERTGRASHLCDEDYAILLQLSLHFRSNNRVHISELLDRCTFEAGFFDCIVEDDSYTYDDCHSVDGGSIYDPANFDDMIKYDAHKIATEERIRISLEHGVTEILDKCTKFYRSRGIYHNVCERAKKIQESIENGTEFVLPDVVERCILCNPYPKVE